MRIINGIHKGRKLNIPEKLPVRPTTDKAKEALFNILQNRFHFYNKTALDLCSGSGNIAYEFASRKCKSITAVDNNIKCINYIKNTSNELNLNIKTIKSDIVKYLEKCIEKFDFIFIDPPYNYTKHELLINLIFKKNIIKKDGILILEHDKNTIIKNKNLELRKYGSVHFSIFSF